MPRSARLVLLLLAALASGPTTASAQQPKRPFSWELGIGMDRGGDKLLTLTFDDGSRESLYANQGFSFYAGVGVARFEAGEVAFDTSVTLGVKGWNVGSQGDTLNYLVFPLEVVERLWFGQARLGAGLSYLVSPRLSGKGALRPLSTDLDNSLGFTLEGAWIGERKPGRAGGSLGLRYAFQRLRFSGASGSVDASTIGLKLGFDF